MHIHTNTNALTHTNINAYTLKTTHKTHIYVQTTHTNKKTWKQTHYTHIHKVKSHTHTHTLIHQHRDTQTSPVVLGSAASLVRNGSDSKSNVGSVDGSAPADGMKNFSDAPQTVWTFADVFLLVFKHKHSSGRVSLERGSWRCSPFPFWRKFPGLGITDSLDRFTSLTQLSSHTNDGFTQIYVRHFNAFYTRRKQVKKSNGIFPSLNSWQSLWPHSRVFLCLCSPPDCCRVWRSSYGTVYVYSLQHGDFWNRFNHTSRKPSLYTKQ